jgi:hypothetical protein
MRIDHRGGDISMAEQLLDRADVFACFEKMCRKAVAERMTRNLLENSSTLNG